MENLTVERITGYTEEIFDALLRGFPDVQWDRTHLADFVGSPTNILLLARKDGVACGTVRAHFLPRYDAKNTEILLHEIDVSPAYQRQGIGTRLIEKLKEVAKENKASEIWTVTNRSNTGAMKLYQTTGALETHDDDVVFAYLFK